MGEEGRRAGKCAEAKLAYLLLQVGGPPGAREVPEEAHALLVLQERPELGIQLVPEHVETRPLYPPRSPGLLQAREGSAPNPRTPGLPPAPGPWALGMPFPQDLY